MAAFTTRLEVQTSMMVTTDPNFKGDDAADAKFWPIETVFSGDLTLAGDHLQILTNWLKPA